MTKQNYELLVFLKFLVFGIQSSEYNLRNVTFVLTTQCLHLKYKQTKMGLHQAAYRIWFYSQ